MHSPTRYEIIGLIGSGDFASVHRARDRELGREVAIKQIHAQFLHDPQRLERFWREAQLLAAVEHPHIMTIYDIDRTRGWLVLELMQGTLIDVCRGQPIDLDLCRAALVGGLQGLALLHHRRTLHGDIKPSNLLVDRHGRVKLGDFGLARRVANDQGSYLKGATRYMAPELVAPQFGPVGPASDLYSLGFSLYELLCGPKFESLFPGLEAFGRDKQIAWMMWHAAPDRKLPEIGRVLAGVPDDLARVIDKLTHKDLSKRYRTADDALADLQSTPQLATAAGSKHDAEAAARKQVWRKRMLAAGALCCSLVVSLALLFTPEKPKPPPEAPPDQPLRGIVRTLIPDRQLLIVELADSGGPKELVLRGDDRVFLNDKVSLLRELHEQDQVTILTHKDEKGRPSLEIKAARPQESSGVVARLEAEKGEMAVTTIDGQELLLTLGPQLPVELNGQTKTEGRPLEPADLKAGDRVVVGHFLSETGQAALKVVAQRVISGEGVLRKLDLTKSKKQASVAASAEDSAPLLTLPISDKCEVILNGRRVLEGRLLGPADLRTGDLVKYERDVQFVRIAATRAFYEKGVIAAIRYDVRSFTTSADRTYTLAPECSVRLGGEDATFEELRKGDRVEVAYDSPDANSPAVVSLDAQRPEDRTKWAIVVASGTFDDASVAPLPAALAEAKTLKARLTERYGIPGEQLTILDDPSRVRWEQTWTEALSKAASAKQLLVVVLARAVVDETGPLLIPKDFAAARAATTGIPLKKLLQEVDASPATQKIVLLDLQTTSGTESAADMLESIRGTKTMPLLKTTPVIATSGSGSGPRLGLATANAVAGAGDANRDSLCELTELFGYLQSAGSSAAGPPVKLILPDNTPLRLTEEARETIRRLARLVGHAKVDVADARTLFQSAEKLAPKQPEPPLIFALTLLKARQAPEAGALLEQLVAQKPGLLPAWEASAWARFERLNYAGSVSDLTQWVTRLPAKGELPESTKRVLPWAGRIRQYVADAAATDRRPDASLLEALDAAVKARGEDAYKMYVQGRKDVRAVTMQFDAQLEASMDDKEKLKISFDRRSPRHYVSFVFDPMVQEVLKGLEE